MDQIPLCYNKLSFYLCWGLDIFANTKPTIKAWIRHPNILWIDIAIIADGHSFVVCLEPYPIVCYEKYIQCEKVNHVYRRIAKTPRPLLYLEFEYNSRKIAKNILCYLVKLEYNSRKFDWEFNTTSELFSRFYGNTLQNKIVYAWLNCLPKRFKICLVFGIRKHNWIIECPGLITYKLTSNVVTNPKLIKIACR